MWKKRWIVVGIAATVLPLVLASCAGSTPTATVTRTVTQATQAPSAVSPTPTTTTTPTTLSTSELVERVKVSVVLILVELPGGNFGGGTGKTLVGMWSAEALESQRTLVLLPSLSLVAQISREWPENIIGNELKGTDSRNREELG